MNKEEALAVATAEADRVLAGVRQNIQRDMQTQIAGIHHDKLTTEVVQVAAQIVTYRMMQQYRTVPRKN